MNEGDIFPFGQRLRQGVPVRDILERAATLSGYREKRLKYQNDCGEKRKGIGLALGVHGSGFTGSGEQKIAGIAKVRWNRDSTVDVLVSSVEMGQGASTVLPMIASEALGIPVSRIRHLLPDTSVVPNSGPTVASRTTMYVGRMVADACRNLLEKLTAYAAFGADAAIPGLSVRNGCISDVSGNVLGAIEEIAQHFLNEKEELSGVSSFHPEYAAQWDDASFRGEAYKAYGWIATVSEVEVDRGTCEIVPIETTCVVDAGVAIHPVLAEGQVEGGALQALGWAYLEDLPCERGRYLTGHLNAYLIPTSQDAPKFTVEFVHNPSPDGPYGAKGLGELPMDAGAPSIASAVECATGAHPTAIPITGEVLYTLLNEGAGKKP
jgi:CO/xanthine dehydrogenase Mo-binding subunit